MSQLIADEAMRQMARDIERARALLDFYEDRLREAEREIVEIKRRIEELKRFDA